MTLYWQDDGDVSAPTIVFLHGFGVSSWMWTEQVAALRERYRCISIDLPGNGKSHKLPWLSLADSAAQVAALIESHVDGGRAHIVGLSLGGYVALNLLANHPEWVESLIVSGINTAPMKNAALLTRLVPPMFKVMQWGPFAAWQGRLMQIPSEVIPLFVEDTRALNPSTVQRVYEEVLTFELPSALAQRKQPVLAVAGEKEVAEVLKGLAAFTRTIPTATTAIAPNAHHTWNAEYPDLFNAMIHDWIAHQTLPTELQPSQSAPAVV